MTKKLLLLAATLLLTATAATAQHSLPYSTHFDDGTPDGWTFLNDTNKWVHGDDVSFSGTHCLYISNDGHSHNYTISGFTARSISYAYTTVLIDQPGDHIVSYHWMCKGENNFDYMRLFLAPDNTNLLAGNDMGINASNLPSNFIALDGGTQLANQSTWAHRTEIVNVPTAGTYKLVLYWHNDSNMGTQPPAAVDDLSLALYTCHTPTGLSLLQATDSSLYLAWDLDSHGEPQQWTLVIDGDILSTDTNSVTINGLEPSTLYTVDLFHECGADGTSIAATGAFRTLCARPTIPFHEGFEGDTLDCWTLYDINASSYTGFSSANPHGGQLSLRLYPGNNSQPIFLASPLLNGLDSLMATFYLRGSNMVHVDVGVMSNASDTGTFLPIDRIDALNATEWTPYEVRLDDQPLSCGHLAFRFATSGSYGYSAYLDDIDIVRAPSCRGPQDATLDSLGAEVLRLHIVDTNGGNTYRLTLADSLGIPFFILNTSDTLLLLGGLMPASNYSLAVSALCSDGHLTPALLLHFRTPSLVPVVSLDGPTEALSHDSLRFTATLLDGSTDSLRLFWHSDLLDTTVPLLDTHFSLAYPSGGTDILTLTATNRYGSASASLTIEVTGCDIILRFPHTEEFINPNPCWTTLDADGDGHVFAPLADPVDPANTLMASLSFSSAFPPHPLQPDNWLLSPFFQLPSEPLQLAWNDYSDPDYPAEHYTVYIFSNLHSPLYTLLDTTLSQGGWGSQAVDLTPWLGQRVRFAFRHHGGNSQLLLGIDHIALRHPEPIDTTDTVPPPPLPQYTLTLLVDNSATGQVYGGGTYDSASHVRINAIPAHGYRFHSWDDGSTQALRTLFLLSDSTLTAHFSPEEVGIADQPQHDFRFSLFPNPSHGTVTLSLPETRPSQPTTLTLLDPTGREVLPPTTLHTPQTTLHLPLPAGTYFLRVTSPHGTAVEKLIFR